MALDRTWYNTLVDDSGSGLDGSVWDKNDVDALMDVIDAEIARIDGEHAQGVFTPTIIGSAGGTPTYAAQSGVYSRAGNLVTVGGRVTLSSKGSLAGSLLIDGFPFTAHPLTNFALVAPYWAGMVLSATSMGLISLGSTQWQIYMGTAGAMFTSPCDVTYVSATYDLIFGGSYLRL